MRQLIEEAKRVISIPSVTADGNEELANYVSTLMRARGLKVQLQQVGHSMDGVSKRQFNVLGVFGDPLVDKKTRKGLLLLTHLDTVGPGRRENWTETGGDAFAPAVKDGRIYGLGAVDIKLDFLAKLRAIEKFREQKLKMPIYLVGSCGAELGMFGAKYLIKSMALNPKFVAVGEPSELKVVYSHKAYSIFRVSIGYSRVSKDAKGFNRRVLLKAFGRSAHGAYPEQGVNAILRLLEFIRAATEAGFDARLTRCSGGDMVNKVPDQAEAEFFVTSHQLEDFKRFFADYCRDSSLTDAFVAEFGGLGESGVQFLPEQVFQALCDSVGLFGQFSAELAESADASFDPPHSTINFGQLREGPNVMELLFDLRLIPGVAPDQVESRITSAFQRLSAHYPGLNLSVVRDRMNPGLEMSLEHELMRICRAAVVESGLSDAEHGFSKMATSTEAAQYFLAGYEAIVFGPGRSNANSHSPNEHTSFEQLEKATRFYEKLIEKTCV